MPRTDCSDPRQSQHVSPILPYVMRGKEGLSMFVISHMAACTTAERAYVRACVGDRENKESRDEM